MKLIDYMNERNLDDEAFARLFNEGLPPDEHRTVSAVKKWKYGERTPEPKPILRIEEITQGMVTLRDLTAEPARVAS